MYILQWLKILHKGIGMKKANVIDLTMYRDELTPPADQPQTVSDELQTAIQNLIHRLRELGPIQQG